MRSRVIVAPQMILSYGLDIDETSKLNSVADKYKAVHKAVLSENLNEKIGYLCGFKGFEQENDDYKQENDAKCLVFSGILQKNISLLLKDLKAVGLNVPLKAIVTPSNQSWRFYELIEELKKEHKFMTERK